MSIFKDKKEQIYTSKENNVRMQLTDKQISDAKPKFRKMIECVREYGILDEEIIEAIKQNISKRVLHDSSLFKF